MPAIPRLSSPLRFLLPAILLGTLLVTPGAAQVELNRETPPPKHDFDRWEKEVAAIEVRDRESPPQPGGIVFVGSSTIRRWKTDQLLSDLPVVNHGFGGSELTDTRHFAERLVIAARPKVVLVYAGSNDLSKGASPIRVHDDFVGFAEKVHKALPETEIVFLSIKPTIRRWAIIHRVRAANALVEAACLDGKHLHFLNVYPDMLNAAGEPEVKYLADDGLHLNDAGYEYLTKLIRPDIERLFRGSATENSTSTDKASR